MPVVEKDGLLVEGWVLLDGVLVEVEVVEEDGLLVVEEGLVEVVVLAEVCGYVLLFFQRFSFA